MKQAVEDIRGSDERYRREALEWIATEDFFAVCDNIPGFDARAYHQYFVMLRDASERDRADMAERLYDKLTETERCLADYEADRAARKAIRDMKAREKLAVAS